MLFGRTKRLDLHRTSPPAFFAAFRWQLGARCSPDRCDNSRAAYALIVPSRPIRFWLLILSLQVLPQNKIKLISSEKKLPQLFDFIWLPGNGMPGLNDIKKIRCQTSPASPWLARGIRRLSLASGWSHDPTRRLSSRYRSRTTSARGGSQV